MEYRQSRTSSFKLNTNTIIKPMIDEEREEVNIIVAARIARRAQDKRKAQLSSRKTEYIKSTVRIQKEKPCTDCGFVFPYYVMDFHHRDPRAKLFGLAKKLPWLTSSLTSPTVSDISLTDPGIRYRSSIGYPSRHHKPYTYLTRPPSPSTSSPPGCWPS